MDEQFFKLQGEPWDLQELALSFEVGPAKVKKIEDFFYLCLEMEPGASTEEKLTRGETALNQINAISLVRDERFRLPRIVGDTQRDSITGKMVTTVSFKGRVEATARLRGNLTVGEADGTIRPRQPTFGEKALKICLTNRPLREALRTYVSVEHNFKDLYAVLETVQKANNGKIPTTWASRREIDAFNNTANNPKLGPASRHGFDPSKAEREPAMTESQGRALVQKVLHAWIEELIAADKSEEPSTP
jgi:hypothetical protein